jgi:hypothetical protein
MSGIALGSNAIGVVFPAESNHRRSRASTRPPVSTYHRSAAVLLLACAEGRPRSHVALLATGVEVSDDPEVNYFFAGHLAYCGETEAALRYLKLAIDGGYCSFPAIDSDPLFTPLRNSTDFVSTRASAIACRNRFAPMVKTVS